MLGEDSDGKKKNKQTALKLVLDFESPSTFWSFLCGTSLYYLPTSCRTVIVMQAAHPLAKKLEDYGFEIGSHQITKFHCENRFKWRADQDRDIFHRRVFRGWP